MFAKISTPNTHKFKFGASRHNGSFTAGDTLTSNPMQFSKHPPNPKCNLNASYNIENPETGYRPKDTASTASKWNEINLTLTKNYDVDDLLYS